MKYFLILTFVIFPRLSYSQITKQPIPAAICSGLNTYFNIKATGNSLLYKWQVKRGNSWSDITSTGVGPSYIGYLSDSLVLSNVVDSSNNYQYRCITSNADTSMAATITVYSKSQTANGILATANPICFGSNSVLSVNGGQLGFGASWKWHLGNCNSSAVQTGNSYTVSPGSNANYYLNAEGYCNTTTCVSITIVVNSLPNITIQPSNVSICPSASTSFSVGATGTNLTYQWQVNQGAGWNNITSTGSNPSYSNYNSNTLSLSSTVATNNGNLYRCVVSGTCTPSVNSNPATLIINTAPTIISQPSNSTICEGQGSTFSVNAGGTGLNYQWEVNNGINWVPITTAGNNPTYSNYNSSTLTLTNTIYANNGFSYRCKITGTCAPSVLTNAVQLTINTSPNISNQANNSSICAGSNTSFSITASGTNLTYQWQVNQGSGWNNISSSGSNPSYSNYNTPSLNITNVTPNNNGYLYRVIVSGTCSPSNTSNAVSLTVYNLPNILSSSSDKTICEGSNTDFSITASGTNLVYQWQVNSGTGWSDINSSGSNPSFSNFNSNTLILNKAISWNNAYKFRCKVSGLCSPSVFSDSSNLAVNTTPTINQNPIDASICELKNTYFQINANGTNLNYQWEINTNNNWKPISIYTSKSTFKNWNTNKLDISNIDTLENNALFKCKISNLACIASLSNFAKLSVNSNPIISAGKDFSLCIGQSDYLKPNTIKSTSQLKYNWTPSTGLDNPAISNPSVNTQINTTFRLTVEDQNTCTAFDEVYLTINPNPTVSISQDTSICSQGSVQLYSYGGLKYNWFPQIGLSNYNIANPIAKPLTTSKYIVHVENVFGCKSSESVNIFVNPLPKTNAGNDTSVCLESSLQLHANGANFYKWTPRNNLNFNDINNPIFKGKNTQTYFIEGGNIYGCYTTDTLTVNVWNLPSVDAGTNFELCFGDSIKLNPTGALKYTWYSNNEKFSPGVTNPTIKPTKNGIYRVTGTDINSCINFDSLSVIVNVLPNVEAGNNTSICQGNSINLNASGAVKYRWSNFTSLNDSSISNPIASPPSSIYFKLTVIDSKGCNNTDSVFINVVALPNVKIKGDTIVCQNTKWSNYRVENLNEKCFWHIEKGAIQTGQGSNKVMIHWKDSMFMESLIVNVRLQEFPFCTNKDVLIVRSTNSKAPNPADIVAKANNIYTNILICKNPNYDHIIWGFENKKTNIEVYTQNGNSWTKYDKLDTFNNYYWAYVGNDTSCLTKSYFNSPVILNTTESPTELSVLIYPNPSIGIFTLDNIKVGAKIEISNSLGQIIKNIESAKSFEIIDLKNEIGNTFFIKIINEHQIIYKKIFKY